MAETIYLLSGSNIGDREKQLEIALDKIEAIPGIEIIASSSLYVSEAVDMVGENPSFINQVIMADYEYLPNELIDELEKIELSMGRDKKGMRLPRTIDIDILFFGEQIVETEKLSIPHKEFLNRSFAMIPLAQISPEFIHPITNIAISKYITNKMREDVVLYKDHVARNI